MQTFSKYHVSAQSISYLKTGVESKPELQSRALHIRPVPLPLNQNLFIKSPRQTQADPDQSATIFQLAEWRAKANTAQGFYEKNVWLNKEAFMC